jgi:hypothetical protein
MEGRSIFRIDETTWIELQVLNREVLRRPRAFL